VVVLELPQRHLQVAAVVEPKAPRMFQPVPVLVQMQVLLMGPHLEYLKMAVLMQAQQLLLRQQRRLTVVNGVAVVAVMAIPARGLQRGIVNWVAVRVAAVPARQLVD
jgi:hypothetical protein